VKANDNNIKNGIQIRGNSWFNQINKKSKTICFNIKFDFLAKDLILPNATNLIIPFLFSHYQHANSQDCLKNETNNDIRALSEFIKEPFAWLLGQSFKYLLDTTTHFDTLFQNSLHDLKIDFNYPIVGYFIVFF
jgi:hypothetical protein